MTESFLMDVATCSPFAKAKARVPALPPFTHVGAEFDPRRVYRYVLVRLWNRALPRIAFCMLNPSTADEFLLDPTVRRCVGFAVRWGYGGLYVLNAFALRSTDPKALYVDSRAAIGPRNDEWIATIGRRTGRVVCAWGVHGALRQRGDEVRVLLDQQGVPLYHLGLTKDGHPRHPLYLKGDVEPVRWP